MRAREELRRLPDVEVRTDEPMSRHTSFRIGGPADILVLPHTSDAVCGALRIAAVHETPVHILGDGSNVLVRDRGLRGVVLKIADNLAAAEVQGERIVAQGGARLGRLAHLAAEASLTGLEFAIGIPGTVGGAAVMNAGAYSGEIGTLIAEVDTVTRDGEPCRHDRDELCFEYRDSSLRRAGEIVVGVVLELRAGEREQIEARMAEMQQQRRDKQPVSLPSAGSIFRRPEGDYAGRLIEAAGLKGACIGGAEVSEKHAGFIVNRGGATAADVIRLIDHVRETVAERTGVRLELEVRIMGDD
ncbi:MAG: UDP-N-acetylmuramate dehydrogenase [Armatimonadota bacterium]